MASEPPLALRDTPSGLHLVATAGGPLGGDEVHLSIAVEEGAELTVRTAAASVALPGPSPSPSHLSVDARVGRGATLRWLVEPTVVAAGCDHRVTTRIELAEGARLVWREELVLGRHAEQPGSTISRIDVHVDGRVLLRHRLAAGPGHPGWASQAVAGGARAAGSVVVVDPDWSPAPPPVAVLGPGAAVLALAGPAVQIIALADDNLQLRRLLDAGLHALGVPST